MDISELIKGGFKECWDFDDDETCDWCGGTGRLKVPKKPVEECGHCDGSGYISKPVKTEQDWSEELSDLQRDAERYRWLIQQVGKVKLNTGASPYAKLFDIGEELSNHIDSRIASYLSGEDW